MLSIDEINKLQMENEAYKQSEQEATEIIAELKAENDRLKEEIKEVKKYQYQQEYLDKEIKEMQKALKTLAEGLNKRQILLQEIKAIAEDAYENESEYQATGVYSEILQKITKAEEE
jgi:uncharacterized protein YukE